MNALLVNCHPSVIAVGGRTSFKHDVNGPSDRSSHGGQLPDETTK